MYKITDTSPNIYVREATVEMNDKSCKGGSPMFIDASMFASYPKGDDFVMNGDQCVYNANSVVDEKKKEYTEINNKYNNRMDKISKNYPQLPLKNKESTNMYKQLNSKTAEYKQVLNKIVEKKKQNNETYQQQMADMNVLENSNKTNSLVWGLSALIVIGMVVMVRNKTL
jgi:transketolase